LCLSNKYGVAKAVKVVVNAMACLLYSWIIGYLRVSARFYVWWGDVGAIFVLTSDGWAVVSS